ncbi:MAG: phosphotransferase [Woeseiaceae bacterium]
MGLNTATVLADVPGWENAAATALSGGLTNHTWLVDNGDAKAVLKLDPVPRGVPYSSRPREAAVQSLAAEHGLAPRVLHVDDCVLMTEFVEGEVWQPGTFAVDDNIEDLANALRRLHALPLTGRSFDAPHAILSAGSIMFLDWEYACDNDPFFDLATIVEHHGLDDDLAMRLLDAYCGGDGRRQLAQLRAQQALYAALYWMWLAARPDTTSAELGRAASRIRD